ncbi:hypothetical protein GCM10010124_28580 [Pilimelia terevasa]|uniref:DUF4360 domain-containing protein n=1 Tax=Pilimelia terevasa TaxID=53372 RepID=A0A8J3BSI9_9ACTN|nr:DUF4360 domain-containing protein [Pilimelia terevasa]GGK34241.1 hypothetical protein GCM10010124_28580 [Pilimelia terevasa]
MNQVVRTTAQTASVLALAIGATLAGASAAAAADPSVELLGVVTEGSGCPRKGDASATLNGDRIKVSYQRLGVSAGGEDGTSSARLNCVANLRLKVDKGWEYAIGTLSMRGAASLVKGAKAEANATHYFAGSTATGEAKEVLRGPYDDEFTSWDRQHGNWSECGATRALNINASVYVESRMSDTASELQLNDRGGLVAELKFRRCD